MDYKKKSVEEMDEKELRMHKSSLRQDLISKRENLRRLQSRLDKENLENIYKGKEREKVEDDLDGRKGRLRAIDNEINRLMADLEARKKTRKSIEEEISRLGRLSSDIDFQIKNKNHSLEELRYEIRELEQEIKRKENDVREI